MNRNKKPQKWVLPRVEIWLVPLQLDERGGEVGVHQ